MAFSPSPTIRAAVIEAYAAATGLTPEAAGAGYNGSPAVPFDSILGLELMVALEDRFNVEIPEEEETRAANFISLAAFARMAGKYVGAPAESKP